jgi:hypothetical protein
MKNISTNSFSFAPLKWKRVLVKDERYPHMKGEYQYESVGDDMDFVIRKWDQYSSGDFKGTFIRITYTIRRKGKLDGYMASEGEYDVSYSNPNPIPKFTSIEEAKARCQEIWEESLSKWVVPQTSK